MYAKKQCGLSVIVTVLDLTPEFCSNRHRCHTATGLHMLACARYCCYRCYDSVGSLECVKVRLSRGEARPSCVVTGKIAQALHINIFDRSRRLALEHCIAYRTKRSLSWQGQDAKKARCQNPFDAAPADS